MLRPLIALLALGTATAVAAKPAYEVTKSTPIGAPDRWDYAVFDAGSGRVYIAHGDRLTVIDGRSGAVVGQVQGIPGGTHGVAITRTEGVTDDGENGQAVAFDTRTFKVTHRLPAAPDADAIAQDKATGHVFVMNGDSGTITVVDPRANVAIATIQAGEKLENGVGDGLGTVFVAGAGNGDLLRLDARANKITARWTAPDCTSPHGLALDAARRRLFLGCLNSVMLVFDANDGHVVSRLPIGRGSDAIAYDPTRRRVFSSNGADGTVSVFQQTGADTYTPLDPIQTAVSGRTMTLNPATGRLFVVAADTDPSATPGGRPRPRPGTLRVMFIDPVG